MKKLLLSLFIIILTLSAVSAQDTIPNKNFEFWDAKYQNTFDVGFDIPVGWVPISNSIALPLIGSGGPVSVSKSISGRTGSAIELKTVTHQQKIVPGVAITGDLPTDYTSFNPNTFKGGFAYKKSPLSLNGFYKYNFVEKDNAIISVFLTKTNGNTNDTIAIGLFTPNATVSIFTPFSVPLIYKGISITPDKATIVLTSSGSSPKGGSILTIDDLSFEGTVAGIQTELFPNFTKAFPNPSRENLTFTNVPASAEKIEVRDITGRIIDVHNASELVNINVSKYNAGIYYYAVRNSSEQLLYSDKFIVIK